MLERAVPHVYLHRDKKGSNLYRVESWLLCVFALGKAGVSAYDKEVWFSSLGRCFVHDVLKWIWCTSNY